MADLTGLQVVEAYNALLALDNENDWRSPRVSLKLGRVIRRLRSEVELLEVERKKIERKYMKADDEGNPIIIDGRVQFNDLDSFEDAVYELNHDVVTVEIVPTTVAALQAALPKKETLKLKGRWAGVLEEAGILTFGEDTDCEDEE